MTSEPSIVQRGEKLWDDLVWLGRRRPSLCIAVCIFLLCPAAVFLWETFGLKDELASARATIAVLTIQRDGAIRDRDAKAGQLAPFLAVANKQFEAAPPDKRLDLLITRLDEVQKTINQAAKTLSELPRARTLTDAQKQQISFMLRDKPKGKFEISSQVGSAESGNYARQFAELFQGLGWSVSVEVGFYDGSPKGLAMYVRNLKEASPYAQLFVNALQSAGLRISGYQGANGMTADVNILLVVGEP